MILTFDTTLQRKVGTAARLANEPEMMKLPPAGLPARPVNKAGTHEGKRAADVWGAFTLGCPWYLFLLDNIERKFTCSSFFRWPIASSLGPSLSLEKRKRIDSNAPFLLSILPHLVSVPLTVDWPEGWRGGGGGAGGSWVQEWAIHPGYLEAGGEGGGGTVGPRSTCLLNKSSLSPFCSCSPINQRGACECS